MKYLSDLHTHTIVSGHAYTTLKENINYCKENGMKILGTADHGPNMPGAPHYWYFANLRTVPREVDGVMILKGCEANILSTEGDIDVPVDGSKSLDYMIASFHEPVFKPKSLEENTDAVINTIKKNPKVEILGHLGNPNYKLDYNKIVQTAKEYNIMIEINNSSIGGTSRVGSSPNCKLIASLCKEYGCKVILTSDAHMDYVIGKFDSSIALLREIDFPEELIMNNPEKLIPHLKSKGALSDLSD